MAKGVKSLKMTKGRYFKENSIINKSMTITANEEATFEVREWHSGTLPEERQKNLTWFWFDNEKKLIKTSTGVRFSITIPKNICGSYTYYIEASYTGNRDFKSGIFVRGKCDPKILKSKWSLKNDAEDIRSREFSFGDNVFLGMETEGINGNFVTVELYRLNDEITIDKIKQWLFNKKYDPTKDDVLAKVFEKQAWVIDGEINTDFTIQHSWKRGTDTNKFYVKIRDGKRYISDYNGDYFHARFLKAKKVVPVKTDIRILNNNTPVKIGNTEKKVDNISTCKFKVIKITERGKPVELFNEGKFIGKIDASDKFYTIKNINYDFNKWNIRSDAKPILDEVVQFLTKLMPYVPVEIGSHTDIRGTDKYNQVLSEKRAKSVVDYLISKGVNVERIHSKGYGKSRLLIQGNNITEIMHEQNRRTTIKFLISDKDALPIAYDVVVPNHKMPLSIGININGVSIEKGCYHRPKKHIKEVKTIDSNITGVTHRLANGSNSFTHDLYSQTPSFASFFNAFFLNDNTMAHRFYVNSCAYYSIMDDEKPTFIIRTFPDAVLTYNIRYAYEKSYFWNDVPVHLVNSFKWLDDLKADVQKEIGRLKFFSDEKVKNITNEIFKAIDEETHKFAIGLHFIYNFSDYKNRKQNTQVIDYTEEYRWVTAIVLILLYTIQFIVVLIILYLTRGKGSFGRIKRFQKFFKFIDKMDDMGFEIMYPQIATNRAAYFLSDNGIVSRVAEENVDSSPILGIKYDKIHSFLEIPEIPGVARAAIGEENIPKAEVKFHFEGDINAQYNVKFNLHTGQIKLTDNLYKTLSNSAGTFNAGVAIGASASILVNGIVEKNINWIPFVRPTNIKIEGHYEAELGGYITFSRQYGIEKMRPYHTDTIFFSGIKGKVKQRFIVKIKDKDWDTNPNDELKEFELVKGRNLTTDRIYLFKI